MGLWGEFRKGVTAVIEEVEEKLCTHDDCRRLAVRSVAFAG